MRLRLFCLLMCLILSAQPVSKRNESYERPVENPVDNSEMVNFFENALRQVVSVSKEDLKRLQEAEQAQKADKPKRGPKPRPNSVTQKE